MMTKALALLLLASMSVSATAQAPSREALAEYVQAMAPRLTDRQAQRFGRIIYDAGTRADIDPVVLAAIVRQESNFMPDQKVCYIATRHRACWGTCDYGLAQINSVWIAKWGLDEEALVHDDAYNVKVATRVLSLLKKEFGDEPQWWSRYNSATPSSRSKYEAYVTGHLAMADIDNGETANE